MKTDVMWPVEVKRQFPEGIQRSLAAWVYRGGCHGLHVIGMTAEKVRFPDGRVMVYALLDLGEAPGEPLPVLYGRTEACRTKSEDARLVAVGQ